MERDTQTKARPDAVDHHPRVADALKSGIAVSVTTWSGKQLLGVVADRDQTGLLLDVDEESDGKGGYVFVPWSSVEQAEIPEIAQRRVKFLQS